jgi:hypothetical protein
MQAKPCQLRVAALGLDSGDWRIIERLFDSGQVPNLARLRSKSDECLIRSDSLYRSTLIWEAFFSGRNYKDDPRGSGVWLNPNTYEVFKIGADPYSVFFAGLLPVRRFPLTCPTLPGIPQPMMFGSVSGERIPMTLR